MTKLQPKIEVSNLDKKLEEISMIQKLRIKLARWILGKHCPCYQMGCHNMVDFQQRSADQLAKAQERKKV
jgi:hypothetical protein